MSLNRKRTKTEHKPQHTDEVLSLIQSYNERLSNGESLTKTRKNGQTLAQKIAFAKDKAELATLLRVQNRLNDKQSRVAHRVLSSIEVIEEDPNFFVTLSMDACHDNRWYRYDRDGKTQKLYQTTIDLLRELLLRIDPSLREKPVAEWPFFLAVMEHFNDEGNLVAPHIHLLLRLDIDISTLRALIDQLWGKAVPEAGTNGIDIQYLDPQGVPERARYLFKHSYQDHEFKLDNGVMPELVCNRYGWSKEAVSHDMWMIRRENFHAALARKSETLH